jgi:hypothetical protein
VLLTAVNVNAAKVCESEERQKSFGGLERLAGGGVHALLSIIRTDESSP